MAFVEKPNSEGVMMRIVCLGWGSLIWDPRELPVALEWQTDGPKLPIEFARQSKDGRITLVITKGMDPVQVLWSAFSIDSLDEARRALACREGVPTKYLKRSIGYWSSARMSSHQESDPIGQWVFPVRTSWTY